MDSPGPSSHDTVPWRNYAMMAAVGLITGIVCIITSQLLDLPMKDPEGFLGPVWTRLPLLVGFAFVLDLVPRTLYRTRGRRAEFKAAAKQLIAEHWTRERVKLAVVGMTCFYLTYVSYRNLKSFLPKAREVDGKPLKFDRPLQRMDEWLFFGHDPAEVLHNILGTGIAAHLLSWVYLFFLPMVPVTVVIWAVWSRNVRIGAWFITAQCICWSLGTLSYYLVPTTGPAFESPWLYKGLADTGVTKLQDALFDGRQDNLFDPQNSPLQSVAGFASLHVAITVSLALIGWYTLKTRWLRNGLWVYSGTTILATTYFGWHYVADDLAGLLIAIIAVYFGGLGTGHRITWNGPKWREERVRERVTTM